jgi:hypothetical protein
MLLAICQFVSAHHPDAEILVPERLFGWSTQASNSAFAALLFSCCITCFVRGCVLDSPDAHADKHSSLSISTIRAFEQQDGI